MISGLEDFAPPTLLAMASRLNFSTRLFNLIVTNVPGPQFPLYLMGREMQEIIPIAFLPENHALAIAAMSYNGRLDFGLLGDYDAMPDIADFAGMLQESLDELVSGRRALHSHPNVGLLRRPLVVRRLVEGARVDAVGAGPKADDRRLAAAQTANPPVLAVALPQVDVDTVDA